MQKKEDVVKKKVKMSMLYELYGNLLTKNQKQCIDDYYNNDLSLTEIAENNNITRQGVTKIQNDYSDEQISEILENVKKEINKI